MENNNKETKVIEVDCCGDCPFCIRHPETEQDFCTELYILDTIKDTREILPQCPLHTSDLIIKLKTKNS